MILLVYYGAYSGQNQGEDSPKAERICNLRFFKPQKISPHIFCGNRVGFFGYYINFSLKPSLLTAREIKKKITSKIKIKKSLAPLSKGINTY